MKKKKTNSTPSYGELLKNFYGVASPNTMFDLNQFEGLIAQYYGRPSEEKKESNPPDSLSPASPALSLSFDNGEVLLQPAGSSQFQEYIVQSLADELAFEEYVVDVDRYSMSSSMSANDSALPMEEARVEQEYLLDVLEPLKETPASPPVQAETAPPSAVNTTPAYEKTPQTPSPAGQPQQPAPVETSKATEADFMEDLQSILTGQKVFDPVSKKTVEKDQSGASQAGQARNNGVERPLPQAQNEQAIFDRIAQSMQYANTFDLGSVELENRFADFDNIHELQENTRKKKSVDADALRGQAPAAKPSSSNAKPPVDTADFLQDLDAIKKVQEPKREASGEAPPVANATSQDYERNYSRPLFDTGEHVLISKDLYPDMLYIQGIPFSYGQIISMGDIYESVKQMTEADVSELKTIKNLIVRSTNYYKGNQSNSALDVSDNEWQDATKKRFLALAEKNYAHFSPNLFVKSSLDNPQDDHRSAWESHHRAAIEEAQRLSIDSDNANTSAFPEWALIINAFGDHFLTDAFAAGHMFNKEEMIELFKANFLQGKSLKPEAHTFFSQVAKLSFKGDVQAKFSRLETSDFVWYKGVIPVGHPNINSAGRFQDVLEGALEERPDVVANLAVKALHDRLNKDGLDVTNGVGDAWRATGDAFMNPRTLDVASKAVIQSAKNITDPAILVSNLDFDLYFDKVWQYVPVLTPTSKKLVVQLMRECTDPKSNDLIAAAVKYITKRVDILIDALKEKNRLRDDPPRPPREPREWKGMKF